MREDLVVVVPGVTGSRLADRDGREVWGPSAGGLARTLRPFGDAAKRLALPAGVGDGPAPDGVRPTGLWPSLHAIPGIWTLVRGYSQLVGFLGAKRFGLSVDSRDPDAPAGNLVLFEYDWRLSNRYSALCLKRRVDCALERWRASAPERGEAKVVFICHSMGGLVARWYLDRLGGAEIARALVTLGTPHRGAAKTLDQLVNGVRKGPPPLQVDLTWFARSLPSSYELLPEYACIRVADGTQLLKTTEVELPTLVASRVSDGMRFHEELDAAPRPTYPIVPVVGIGQPTQTSASLVEDRLVTTPFFGGADRGGDGTVPRLAARPKAMSELDATIRGVGEGHAALTAHTVVTDQLDYLLTAEEITYRAVPAAQQGIGVGVADLHERGEDVALSVSYQSARTLEALAFDESGAEAGWAGVRFSGETDGDGRALGVASLEGLDAGAYTIVVRTPGDPRLLDVSPVHAATLVLG